MCFEFDIKERTDEAEINFLMIGGKIDGKTI